GMRQRLALATALLGDPQVLVLDEPANGLDPEGIAWLRNFLRAFAANGRTVLVSSHLLREMEHTVDSVVIISRGQCVYDGRLDDLRAAQRSRALVQASDPNRMVEKLQEAGLEVEFLADGRLAVHNADSRTVADLAWEAGGALTTMQDEHIDLEKVFVQLTSGQPSANPRVPPEQWGPGHQPGQPGNPGGYACWSPRWFVRSSARSSRST